MAASRNKYDLNDVSKICDALHRIIINMGRHCFPFEEGAIPVNGIYILFEKGEKAHGGDRIVRVGTHTGEGQLKSRLQQHFLNENKDRSIFRKNIGRAILAKENDPFLSHWNIDLTTRKAKNQYAHLIDMGKQREIEKRVTEYIQDSFSFIVIRVDQKEVRLYLESRIISTVSHCLQCAPTASWFGLYSPTTRIKKSGLWLSNELWKKPFSFEELKEFEKTLSPNAGSAEAVLQK